MRSAHRFLPFVAILAATAAYAQAPQPAAARDTASATPASRITVDRIFRAGDFRSAPFPSVQWMKDGRSYLDVRPAGLVKVDVTTGAVTVLAPASALVDAAGKAIEVEDVQLAPDESKALLFHNSVRVWRTNTRGVYHVVDFATKRVIPIATITTPGAAASTSSDTAAAPYLGKNPSFLARGLASGAADPDLQQFAKFSPDGRMVAFVRANDLWVTEIASGRETRLTRDGSDDVVNGTTDWVYEEELGLRDAFRWSPDSKRVAYWRFDQSQVPAFPIVDETSLYPTVSVLRYPKAGQANSRVTLGVVAATGGATRWLDVGPDTGNYLARAEWVGNDSVLVQRLPRRQNQVDLLMASAATGRTRLVLTDRDAAYVDVEGEGLTWLDGQRRFLFRSDRSGWRAWYLYDRSGRLVRQVTPDGADVLDVAGVDEPHGWLYATAAAPDPTQRQVYRYALSGGARPAAGVRVTEAPGTHGFNMSADARYAVDVHSTLTAAPTMTLYEMVNGQPQQRRVLQDNAALQRKLAALALGPAGFLKVPMPDGTQLDAFRITPPGFDPAKKYPVLMYVYGGPANPTVNDAWGGTRYLWHLALAQMGYVVVSVDNRGAAWRGTSFRKITQLRLGAHESQDQMDAARWLGKQSWVDAGRIGIWGWSYGGYLTTLTAAKGGDLFKAAIAVAPVTDWRLYDSIYTERFMWTPQQNKEGYDQGAPQNFVQGLRANFLVVHGTGDDNVHPQNTIQLANKLEAAGRPFSMILYPNRTHSISGGNTSAHLFDELTRFLVANL